MFKWQKGSSTGNHRCIDCGHDLSRHDMRPRNILMRLKHPDSHLYICRACGCQNLIETSSESKAAAKLRQSGNHAPVEVTSKAERLHQIKLRIARNKRAYIKLREIIESDQRLLKVMSEREQGQ